VPVRRLPRPQIAGPAVVPAAGAPAPPAGQRMPQSQRREQLLDVTLELLSEQGFTALSMEAVARRAGVNRAVIYRSFANIGVLLVALLHREDRRVRAALARVIPTTPAGTPSSSARRSRDSWRT
jgi:AcrR family transcriptional regulator